MIFLPFTCQSFLHGRPMSWSKTRHWKPSFRFARNLPPDISSPYFQGPETYPSYEPGKPNLQTCISVRYIWETKFLIPVKYYMKLWSLHPRWISTRPKGHSLCYVWVERNFITSRPPTLPDRASFYAWEWQRFSQGTNPTHLWCGTVWLLGLNPQDPAVVHA